MNFLTKPSNNVLAACMLLLITVPPLAAQETRTVSGRVRNPEGQPISGADVFLLKTLEGALTDSTGTFTFASGARGDVTVVARKRNHSEVRREARLPLDGPLTIVMRLAPVALEPITVEAGTYRLGNLPDVALSELDVVRTPGSAADPFRAIQTFPRLQSVGEGAGLSVRGVAVPETLIPLDGPTGCSPFRPCNTLPLLFRRLAPLLLTGAANELDLTAALGGVSGRVHLDLSESFGGRATATYTNTDALLRLNGRREEFDEAPLSTDLSGGFEWAWGEGAGVKSFAMFQTDRVGVRIDDPGYSGVYRSDARADLVSVSGRHIFGSLGVSWTAATSGSRKDDNFGVCRMEREDRLTQARARVETSVRTGMALAAGTEFEGRAADLAGSVPTASHDNAPGAPRTVFAGREAGNRLGGFGEIELQPSGAFRLLLGARADHSTFTGRTTADPRVSATYRPHEHLTLTTAWGVFHQVPDPLLYEPTLGDPTLPSMASRHLIGGVTWSDGERLIRVETYRKRYESLAARTRDAVTRGRGTGYSGGLDVFVKEDLGFLGLTGRLSYSFIDSRRTDPDSGELAPSPFDATHTLHIVLTRGFRGWLETGVAYRAATGTPFTPIREAVFDQERVMWEPVFGAPMSDRFPDYSRLDLSAYALRRLRAGNLTVLFVSVMNVLDAANIRDYRYTGDYSERIPLATPFPRTLYFGVTTTLPF